MRVLLVCLAVSVVAGTPARASDARARDILTRDFDRGISDTIELAEIASPPFGEAKRGKRYRAMFEEAGFVNTMIDAEGNVLALLASGRRRGPVVIVSAHMDTVFPADTDLTVRRGDDRLKGPGIGDDARGMAVVLTMARALREAKTRTEHDILFVGTVGEEAEGDLRGVRHLLAKGEYAGRVRAFLSVDGIDPARIVNAAVGSKRYRSIFTGPGGHSFNAFGAPNPMVALAETVRALYAIPVPTDPRTTYSASVVRGGTSVNAIPAEVSLDVDLRSRSATELARLDRLYREAAMGAVESENRVRGDEVASIAVRHEPIGDRPAGQTPQSNPLVLAAQASLKRYGFAPQLAVASTDANLAMSLAIPALTIGTGGQGGREHTLDEWIELPRDETLRGMAAALDTVIAAARLR